MHTGSKCCGGDITARRVAGSTRALCQSCGRHCAIVRLDYEHPAGPPLPPERVARMFRDAMDREVEVHEFATIEIDQPGNRLLAGPFERIGRHLDRKTRPVRQCARGLLGAVRMAVRSLVRRGM